MSEKTAIQWTDHTFNIAWGCTKVSPGCANCYADRDSHRHGFDVWGPTAARRVFGEKHWNDPRKWNRAAEKDSRRRRVFCSSMCDVFEDNPTIDRERRKLWPLIDETPWLDWQILTKRADRMRALVPQEWRNGPIPMKNVWLGVSVENQEAADERIPHLLATPAAVRFLSCEPLLGPIDLAKACAPRSEGEWLNQVECGHRLHWIIVGGESGPKARSCYLEWFAAIVRQCKAAGVPVFVKQLGANIIDRRGHDGRDEYGMWPYAVPSKFINEQFTRVRLWDRKGGDMAEWPAELRVREFPETTGVEGK